MPHHQSDNEIVLSLISHTNVGKTALARTLLRKDVGEVADSAHVTLVPESYPLIESGELIAKLWDTPGFGSNLAKLAKRIRSSSNPVGWILHQVWDRTQDRSLWCSQEAIRNVQADADVVVYLVDASQSPSTIGYVDLEIEIIEWIGKPVLVFINQTGEPDPERDRRNEEEWRVHLETHSIVRNVATLDAFTRCWTQEHLILSLAAGVVPGEKKKTAETLTAEWVRRNLQLFEKSVVVMAQLAGFALGDTEPLPERGFLDNFLQLLQRKERSRELDRIQKTMYQRLSERTHIAVNQLIRLNGLSGETAAKLARNSREAFAVKRDVDKSLMAVLGGVGSGLLTGLGADLAAGGMTLGGGAIVGMLVGGATTYALAFGYNLTQTGKNRVRWSESQFLDQVKSIVMLYLAVSHFGRGRGAWQDPVNNSARWEMIVRTEIDRDKSAWLSLWKKGATNGESESVNAGLERQFFRLLKQVFTGIYPDSKKLFRNL